MKARLGASWREGAGQTRWFSSLRGGHNRPRLGGPERRPASSMPLSELKDNYGSISDQKDAYLCSPLPSGHQLVQGAGVDRSELPIFVYLSGLDGTGLAAFKQFPSLMEHFRLITYVVPPSNRDSFATLVDDLNEFFEGVMLDVSPTTPVYLMGESFGGLLAIQLATKNPGLVDRVVLVNPATSFNRSLWPRIGPVLLQTPPEAYGLLPILLAPVLGNPINLLSGSLDGARENDLTQQALRLFDGALSLLQQLPILAEILPRDTLEHKLKLLAEGCEAVEKNYGSVEQRVFVLVADQDLLLPSEEEGKELKRRLPRCHLRVEKGRSHALLQEGGVDLVDIMKQEGFFVQDRALSSPLKKRVNKSFWGTPYPIELPTEVELKRSGDLTKLSRTLTSPVFISTAADGSMALGLDNVPLHEEYDRPIVFVGNHQSLALDMGIFVEEMLRERRRLLRGLAHPAIFRRVGDRKGERQASHNDPNTSVNQGILPDVMPWFINSLRNTERTDGNSSNSFRTFLEEFGATPVGGKSFARLLANKEAVLLYPGGVSEAYRKKNQEYQLFWPTERAEFVRMAAKYNATIVPFAAVGVDDSLEMLLDSSELKDIPFIGPWVENASRNAPQARQGVEEDFISPLALPKLPPNRMYFLFGRPIETSAEMVKDRDRTNEVYSQVKESVESGIAYLLEKRTSDPYGDFRKRMVYENQPFTTKHRKAPTFEL
jgi:pimeloyl-ACP methyl ester carboxylesterase